MQEHSFAHINHIPTRQSSSCRNRVLTTLCHLPIRSFVLHTGCGITLDSLQDQHGSVSGLGASRVSRANGMYLRRRNDIFQYLLPPYTCEQPVVYFERPDCTALWTIVLPVSASAKYTIGPSQIPAGFPTCGSLNRIQAWCSNCRPHLVPPLHEGTRQLGSRQKLGSYAITNRLILSFCISKLARQIVPLQTSI